MPTYQLTISRPAQADRRASKIVVQGMPRAEPMTVAEMRSVVEIERVLSDLTGLRVRLEDVEAEK